MQAKLDPPRIVLNAVEGWGKTSYGAHAPKAAILCAAGDTGYATLLGAGRVPAILGTEIRTWAELFDTIEGLAQNDTEVGTLILDAIGGFERMCHEVVCKQHFGGDWGDKGFLSFHKGYELAAGEWLGLLSRLDRLRASRGTTIVLLSHCKVGTFKNPMGSDFDRYASDVHAKTWAPTARWADVVLFGNFETIVEGGGEGDKRKKGKGVGMANRIVYTERRDAFDAKNRYGMPPMIQMPGDPSATWDAIWGYIRPR